MGRLKLRGGSALGQAALVLMAWIYLAGVHWDNDGLWVRGDAPHHAANGLFWKDTLRALPADPRGYALRYYARYPVIMPTAYPPAFYLLEAAAYAVFGASPYVAKSLVLIFALVAGLYTTAWLRHAFGPEAGWAGALVLLLPGVVRYSHAVMLNVPAFALTVGALYHGRRWLEAPPEAPAWGQLYLLAVLGVLAVLTYYPAAVAAFVFLAWLVVLRRGDLLRRPRTLAVALAAGLAVLPCAVVAVRWAPLQVSYVTVSPARAGDVLSWTFYPRRLPELFSPAAMVLAAGGILAGLWQRAWRRETVLLLVWVAVSYVFFSYLAAKESRYILPLATPLIGFVALAVLTLAGGVAALLPRLPVAGKGWALVGFAVLVGVEAYHAAQVAVPVVRGFPQVAAFLAQVAPGEPVLYDGPYDGVLTFYVQAGDPDHRRRVVLSRELFGRTPANGCTLQAASTAGLAGGSYGPLLAALGLAPGRTDARYVLAVLQTRGGCHWIAVEQSGLAGQAAAVWELRGAVHDPPFQLVRSFPMIGRELSRIDVYRLDVPVREATEVELPFPSLGGNQPQRVRPLPPNR